MKRRNTLSSQLHKALYVLAVWCARPPGFFQRYVKRGRRKAPTYFSLGRFLNGTFLKRNAISYRMCLSDVS